MIEITEDGGAVSDTYVQHGALSPAGQRRFLSLNRRRLAAKPRYLEALQFAVAAHADVSQAARGLDSRT